DGNRSELRQIGMAAEGTAADTDASQDFGLIPDADLAQFNPGLEDRGQILYQFPEVHPPVRGNIEQDFVVVKGVFRVDELHVQIVGGDLLLTDLKSLLLFPSIALLPGIVLGGGNADHFFQRLHDPAVLHLPGAQNYTAVLHASGCLYDYVISRFDVQRFRTEVVDLPHVAKSHSDNCSHLSSP